MNKHQNPTNQIHCTRCGSTDLYKYGKQQKSNKQKYLCKRCNYQSPMDHEYHPQPIGSPHGTCPKCGAKLEIRKINVSTVQLRCSNRPLCKYSTSRPLNLKIFIQRMFKFSSNTNNFFKLPKFFKYPSQIVFKTLELFYDLNLSSRKTKSKLKNDIQLSKLSTKIPSHVTILSWATKFGYYFSLLLNNYFKSIPPLNSTTWLIDETTIKINGSKYYLFVALDSYSRFVLAWYLSPTKDAQAAIKLLILAKNFTKSKPNYIVSDHAQNFLLAVQQVFGNSVSYYRVHLYHHYNHLSNNKIERFFSYIKSFFKLRKSPKSYNFAFATLSVSILIYNFFKIHSAINAPPATLLNICLNVKDHFLEVFSKCLS